MRIRFFITFLLCFSFLSFPTHTLALTKFSRKFKKKFKGRNKRQQTEASGPSPGGVCHRNKFKSEGPLPLPEEGIGKGALKVLTTLHGTCEAAKPIKNLRNTFLKNRKRRRPAYEHLNTSNNPNARREDREIHIPGFKKEGRSLRGIINSKDFLEGGPYGAALKTNTGLCPRNRGDKRRADPAKIPKAFGFGAAGHLNDKGEYDLFKCGDPAYVNRISAVGKAYTCGLTPSSHPAMTLDCAEFVGAASIASCQKLHKNQVVDKKGFKFPNGRELSTASMVAAARSKDSGSCLTNKALVNSNFPIRPGDMFAGAEAHSIMITRVGSDPLGVQHGLKNGCHNINFRNLNFDLAHSASFGALGPINSSARDYADLVHGAAGGTAYPLNKIVAMARVMCNRAKANGGKVSGKAQDFFDPRDGGKFSLIRHKSGDPECSYAPGKCPKVAGSSCADYCEQKGVL